MAYMVGAKVKLRSGLKHGGNYGGCRFFNNMRNDDVMIIRSAEICPMNIIKYKMVGDEDNYYSDEMLEPADEHIFNVTITNNKITVVDGDKKGTARYDGSNIEKSIKMAIDDMNDVWPRHGDSYWTIDGSIIDLEVLEVFFDRDTLYDQERKKKKMCFRTKESAQAFIDRVYAFIAGGMRINE